MSRYQYDHDTYIKRSGRVGDTYLDRLEQRRSQESIEPVFEVGPIEQHGVVGFESEGFNSSYPVTNSFLRVGEMKKRLGWSTY